MEDKRYIPHKYQKEFHKSAERFRLLIAGRRGGKSLAGTIEALWWADQNPGSTGVIVAPTYPMLSDVNIPTFFQWLPEQQVKSWNKQEKRLELVNGSEIRFRSGDTPDRLRGAEYDWAWLDEACFMKKDAWEVLYPTLTSTEGVAWITTTPQGFDWVHQTFYKPAMEGTEDYAAWQYRTVDNPHINADMVEKAKREMSSQMFRQEYLASFEKFTGLVYTDFDTKVNVISEDVETDKHGLLYFVGIDVGYTNPTAALLMAEDTSHNIYVLDEMYESRLTAPEIASRVKELVGKRKIDYYVIDPASKGTSQTSEMSVYEQLVENGLYAEPGNNDVRAGIDRTTQLLRNIKENKKRGVEEQMPGLYIHERCTNTIAEMERYEWNEKRGGNDDSNKDERPRKAFDHTLDATRYVIMSRPDWFDRPTTDIYGRIVDTSDAVYSSGDDWEDML